MLKPTGYIVVPSSRSLPPVIAYSFENDFGEVSDDNVLLELLKADISSRIDNSHLISDNIVKTRFEQWQTYMSHTKNKNLVSTVGPLLNTKWIKKLLKKTQKIISKLTKTLFQD